MFVLRVQTSILFMDQITSNIINKMIFLKEILGPDLLDLYPSIIKIIYHPKILTMFIFGSKNMFKILQGFAPMMSNDSFLHGICQAIDLCARILDLKTPKQYYKFLDYCILLFLALMSKSISSYDKDPVITFGKMLGMLNINTCGEFIIERGLLGIYTALRFV